MRLTSTSDAAALMHYGYRTGSGRYLQGGRERSNFFKVIYRTARGPSELPVAAT